MSISLGSSIENIWEPVEGLLAPGLFVLGCAPELVHERNILVQQLARSVALGDDFMGLPTNKCGILLATTEPVLFATTEPEKVKGRLRIVPFGGIIWEYDILPAGVEVKLWSANDDPRSWPPRIAALDNPSGVGKWQAKWLGVASPNSFPRHDVVILGLWSDVLPWPKNWFEYYLGYVPANSEKGRRIALDAMEKIVVRQLNAWARERGICIIVFHELSDKQDRLAGTTVGLHEANQIWLKKRGKRGYALVVPEKTHYGQARSIRLIRDAIGMFHEDREESRDQSQPVRVKAAIRRPEDPQIKEFLTANTGRFNLKEIVLGCGAEWPKDKNRYYKALKRKGRLVEMGEVTEHAKDKDNGYPEITFSISQ